jgi:tetratricopeptide (TPR) repeat protein
MLLCSLALGAAGGARALPPTPDAASPLLQLIARGDTALRRGDSISAISFYRDAVTRAPRDPRGYAALGRAYLTVREPEHAREAFESGTRHTNGSDALSLGLIETYEQLGKHEQALAVARALARTAEDVLLAQETLARLAERRAAFSEALAARRKRLAQLRAQGEERRAERDQEALRVRALVLLLGGAERLSATHCRERQKSPVLSVLMDCASSPTAAGR